MFAFRFNIALRNKHLEVLFPPQPMKEDQHTEELSIILLTREQCKTTDWLFVLLRPLLVLALLYRGHQMNDTKLNSGTHTAKAAIIYYSCNSPPFRTIE